MLGSVIKISQVVGGNHKDIFNIHFLYGGVDVVVDIEAAAACSDEEIISELRFIQDNWEAIDAIEYIWDMFAGTIGGYGDINYYLIEIAKSEVEVQRMVSVFNAMKDHNDFSILGSLAKKFFMAYSFVGGIYTHRDQIGIIRSEISRNHKEIWEQLVEIYGESCCACGSISRLTIDHKYPIFRGGTNDIENLWILCQKCNSRKYARWDSKFIPTDEFWIEKMKGAFNG